MEKDLFNYEGETGIGESADDMSFDGQVEAETLLDAVEQIIARCKRHFPEFVINKIEREH